MTSKSDNKGPLNLAAAAMLREQRTSEGSRLCCYKGQIDDLKAEIREKDQIILNLRLFSNEWKEKNEELVKENSMLRSRLGGFYADQLAEVNEKYVKELQGQLAEIHRLKKYAMELEDKLRKMNKDRENNGVIESKYKEYQSQIEMLMKKVQNSEAESAFKGKKLEEYALREKDHQLAMKKIIIDVQNAIKDLENRFKNIAKKVQDLDDRNKSLEDKLKYLQMKISEKKQMENSSQKYLDLVEKFNELNDSYQKLMKKYENIGLYGNNGKALEEKIKALESLLATSQEKILALETSEKGLKDANDSLQGQAKAFETKARDYYYKILSFQTEMEEKDYKITKYKYKIEQLQQEIKSSFSRIDALKAQIAKNEQNQILILHLQEMNKQEICKRNLMRDEMEKHKKRIDDLESQLKSKSNGPKKNSNDVSSLLLQKIEYMKNELETYNPSESSVIKEIKVYKGAVHSILNCISKIESSCRSLESDFKCKKCLKVDGIEIMQCGHSNCLHCGRRCLECAAEVPAFNTNIFYRLSRRINDLLRNTENTRDLITRELDNPKFVY